MTKYKKVYRDHYDPRSGLRWFSADRVPVKRRFPIEVLPKILMAFFGVSYTIFWIYWAVTVAVPTIL